MLTFSSSLTHASSVLSSNHIIQQLFCSTAATAWDLAAYHSHSFEPQRHAQLVLVKY